MPFNNEGDEQISLEDEDVEGKDAEAEDEDAEYEADEEPLPAWLATAKELLSKGKLSAMNIAKSIKHAAGGMVPGDAQILKYNLLEDGFDDQRVFAVVDALNQL